jgi:penicillin-binding protein 1A
MAKKKSGRKEPTFGLPSSLSELRMNPQDRVASADDKPKPSPRKSSGKRKSGKSRGGITGFFKKIIYWGAVVGLWGAIAVIGLVIYVGAHLPPIQSLEIPKRPPTIQITGLDGSVLAMRGEMAGGTVALKNLPAYLPNAFIAIEDRRFYSHYGVDPLGIARAAVTNVMHRGVAQGGSTLTQQLAKNLFLSEERTMKRKLQEVELAFWLERKHSKQEILELYLNRVYFGSGAYGVEAAAQRYFGKPAKDVTIAEAAMLAGLVKSPSRLAPNRNPEGAEARARTVLAAMQDAGFISQAQAQASTGHASYNVKAVGAGTVNYVADWIGEVLDDLIGQVDQSIVVETTLDPKLQSLAEASIIDELAAKSVKFNVSQGALVAMTPDGAVRAMVGGRNYAESQFNRAVTAKRQPGSSFKPFVYLTAIEAGLTPETIRSDAPLDVKGWKPENYTHQYFGPVTLTQALSMSLNTVAVRLGLEVGAKSVVRTAHRLGIASKLEANASIALGTSEVSLTEMVGAYASFANGGLAASPYVVERIRTVDGNKTLYRRLKETPAAVIDARAVAMMNTMMTETLISGSARKAELPGWQAAGKTGTSQDFRDAWFIGYTSRLVTGVWLGNDDNSPTKKATGGGLPVEIWTRFMKVAHQGAAPEPIPGAAPSSFFNSVAAAVSQVIPGATEPQLRPQPGYVPSAPVYTGNRPQPSAPPTPTSYPARQAPPPRDNVRPEAASGLDGWLTDRLFGR